MMLRACLLLLAVAASALAAVDYRPPSPSNHDHQGRRHHNGHHGNRHGQNLGVRVHGQRQHGHHNNRRRGHHGASQSRPNPLGVTSDWSHQPSWLSHLIEPLEPFGTLDWDLNIFGSTPWWKGINVCESHHETTENVTSSQSSIDGAPITHHHFFTRSSCDETTSAYKCTTIINVGGVKKTVTVTLECCHGFQRAKDEPGCPTALDLHPLPLTLREVGASEMLRGLESTGLTGLLGDGNYTVFAPEDRAFKELMIQPDQTSKENVVVITPEMREVVGNIESVLLAHVVPGIIKTSVFSDELLLPTSSPGIDIRINIYDNPKKLMTANCVPIERPDQIAENGVVHVVKDLLPTPDLTVADIVGKDPELSLLKTMMGRLGIVQTLRSNGQYTLFAPTNAAFEHIKPALLNKLMNGDACLGTLIRTHLLPNVICSSIIIGKVKTRNVLGNFVNLTRDGSEKMWLGHAQITKRDIMASNGVVHLVDNVIIPDDVLDVLEVAEKVGATSFVKLVKEAGLTKEIEGNDNVTLFLPSNQALRKLPEAELASLKSDREALADFLRYHVAPGLIRSSSIRHNRRFKTLNGDKTIAIKEFYSNPFGIRRITTAQCAPISHRDLETCNGVVHIIDKVMLPPKGDVLDTLSQMTNMSTTSRLLKMSGLAESLQAEGPFTFIAPSNAAWDALGETFMERLTSEPATVQSLLKHHITSGTICCSGIFHSRWLYKQRERMLDSSTMSFNKNGNGYVAGRQTPISKCDVTATNGVVHVIDAVLPEALRKHARFGLSREVEEEEEEEESEGPGSPPSFWNRHTEQLRRQWNRHIPRFQHNMMNNMNMHWESFLEHVKNMQHRIGSQDWSNMRFRFGSKKK